MVQHGLLREIIRRRVIILDRRENDENVGIAVNDIRADIMRQQIPTWKLSYD